LRVWYEYEYERAMILSAFENRLRAKFSTFNPYENWGKGGRDRAVFKGRGFTGSN